MKLYFSFFVGALALSHGWVWAETLPSAVPLHEEELAAVEPAAAPPVSATIAADIYVVTTSVTLPDTAGFARDAALVQLARKALPVVLSRLTPPVPAEKAQAMAKAVGDPMALVASYSIGKESIVPAYTLTATLVFNKALITKNFGGVKVAAPVVVPSATAVVSGTAEPVNAAGVSGTVAVPGGESRTWTLRMQDPTPERLERLKKTVDAVAGETSRWASFESAGAELVVEGPVPLEDIEKVLKAAGMMPTPGGPSALDVSF